MTAEKRRYLELKALLAAELDALRGFGHSLSRQDSHKFRVTGQVCPACGSPFDWVRLFGGDRLNRDDKGDFEVASITESDAPLQCPCGAGTGFDFLFRRGASPQSEERRKLYEVCRRKLAENSGLSTDEIARFLRFIFRLFIVEDILRLGVHQERPLTRVIEIADVHRRFRVGSTDVEALKGVNFRVDRGEFVALVGSSGAGKSTLLNIIGCIDRPTSGRVLIDGIDVTGLDEGGCSQLRNQRIGFVFQSFNLLPVLNVFENVELPLLARPSMSEEERRRRTLAAIADVNLSPYLDHRPDQLSGGQRQRVAIARALVIGPSLIIADEPTANLDSKTAHHIVNVMVELNELHGVTFLFSTHDEKLINRVRRIAKIVDGAIVES